MVPAGLPAEWQSARGRTREVARGVRDFAPGLDGLCYGFWALALGVMHDTVGYIVGMAEAGATLPEVVRGSRKVNIPSHVLMGEGHTPELVARAIAASASHCGGFHQHEEPHLATAMEFCCEAVAGIDLHLGIHQGVL